MPEKLIYSKVKINSGEIGYVKLGSGRPLVMVTRYAATLYNWDSDLIARLALQFTVYLLDLRLVGCSNSTNTQDINGCVEDINEAITALEINHPIILGWSFGGVIVQEYYKAYPDNISGLVLLSSFPDPRLASAEFIELSMGTAVELDEVQKAKLYHLMVSELPAEDKPNKLRYGTLAIDGYNYRYTAAAKELHNKFVLTSQGMQAADLAKISMPTLILNAKDDLSFPSSGREMFINNIPDSKLIVYPNGGHLLIHHNGAAIALDICNYFV